jgi:hypothetical protein
MSILSHARATTMVPLAAAIVACDAGAGHHTSRAGPELVQVLNIDLAEHDTLYIGRPRDLTIDPVDGTLHIVDSFSSRVLRYGRNGRPLMQYGRKGRGPGEFSQLTKVTALDSLLLAADIGSRRLSVFDKQTGEFIRDFSGIGIPGTAAGWQGRMWWGAQDLDSRTSLLLWETGADSLRKLGPIPEEYFRSQPLAGIYNGIHPTAWADTVLIGFAGSADVWLLHSDGRAIGRQRIPALRRRGVPPDAVQQLETMEFPEMFRLLSVLFAVHRLPGGDFAMVHFDQEIGYSGDITADVYVSVLSADRSMVCVDRYLPVVQHSQPRVAFRGDTLFVLEQRVEGHRSTTSIRGLQVQTANCDWQPVQVAKQTSDGRRGVKAWPSVAWLSRPLRRSVSPQG